MAGLASLALVAGLSGLTASPAAAAEETDHVALPKTGFAVDVVAASNGGIILAPARDDAPYRVSVDNGQTFSDLTAATDFVGLASYAGGGKVTYVNPTGGSDAGGDFFNLYTYDLATGTTPAPVKVYTTEPPLAVNADDAVVVDDSVPSGFVAVHLANGARTPLLVPDHGETPRFTLNGSTALAATSGFLDSVQLNGSPPMSKDVSGLVTARISGVRAYWIEADHTSARFCMAVSVTLGFAQCRQLAAGDYASVPASLEAGNGWVVARLGNDPVTSLEYVYVVATDHITPVTPAPGMQSLKVYGRGDTATPLATVLAAEGGYIGTYSAGTVTKLFDLPETPATTSMLSVTPQSVSGLDNRPAAGVHGQQAWTRSLNGVSLDPEQLLSPRANDLSTSGDRSLITADDGAHPFDAGQPGPALAGITDARSLSGPYFLSGSASNADVRRVNGTIALASAGHVVGLFGSLALRAADPNYQVVDAENAAHTWPVNLAANCGSGTFVAKGIWGDWVLAEETDGRNTVVLNYRTSACAGHDGQPAAIGDGFAIVLPANQVIGTPDLRVWNFRNGHDALLAGTPTAVATDGSHKVAWTDAAGLWTSTVDEVVTPSAPRVLGVLAPDSVLSGSTWKLDLDASKGLQEAGLGLEISNGTDVVRRIAVPDTPNGSVRLTWDGKLDNGDPVPLGQYTWQLKLYGSDTHDALVNTDGSPTVAGSVTVGAPLPLVTAPTTVTLSMTEPFIGSVITVDHGVWTADGDQVHYAYLWYRDGVAIPGAIAETYTAGENDATHTLTAAVTGSAPAHNPVTVMSDSTSVVKDTVEGTVPTLSTSTPVVGEAVSATPGAWAPAGLDLTYQWYRDDATAIPDATQSSYTPSETDLGSTLKVEVTGSKPPLNALALISASSDAVSSPPPTELPPVVGAIPTLSTTTPIVGKTLEAHPGTWVPAVGSGGTALSYQWYRDATPIGAASATYIPVIGDIGHTLKVEVTGSATDHTPVSKTSASTSAVTNGTFVKTVPSLSNTRPAVDQTVTAVPGNWGTGDVKFAYQWYRVTSKSKAIAGATSASYHVVSKDVGYKLKVKVTGTVAGVGTATLYSKVTSKVKKASFVLTKPLSITGTAKVGQTLTFLGAWSGAPTLKYQWYRGSKAIKKAKSQTYLLTTADLNKVMKVKVTATRSGYNTVVKTVKLATRIGPAV